MFFATHFSRPDALRQRFAEHDWSNSVLGPVDRWPPAIRTVLRLMLDAKHPMFVFWGAELGLLYNDAYTDFLQDKHPAAIGQPFAQVWPEIWPELSPLIGRALAGESIYIEDMPFVMFRNGRHEQAWFTFSYSPIYDDDGAIVGLYGTGVDTTSRVTTEARLQAAHARLERLLGERTAERDRIWDIAHDILAIATTDGFFLSCNPALTKLLGWTEAELQVTPFSTFAHPDQLGELGGVMARLAAGETITQYEIRSRHKDGSYRWLSWTVVPQDRVLYMAGRDVTEARAQQEALRQAEEALRQAQKMEAIGQLTGGVAHDFNNMLAAMVGNLQLARLHLDAGRVGNLARYIEGAEKVAHRAATLTHRLLAFARRQTLDPKPTNVELLVSSMLELITRTVGPGITVGTEYASAWRTTYCDPNQLENALLNLAINARDAMPGGGRLLIRTTDVGTGSGADAFVRISITDSGSGMAPEVAGRAFEPFYTTKPIGQGTGLGLSMVFGFVSQSGGRVHLDSTPGAGTTVSLDLPRHLGEAPGPDPLPPQAPRQASPHASPCASRGRILLVDDEVALREVLAELLRDAGMEVIEAGDGPAALDQLRRLDAIDLLVTDVGLPGMNGRQLADAVRVDAPDTTVLFITGYAESALGNAALEPGMHIMVKPFGLDTFAARVAALLAGHGSRVRLPQDRLA